jgi:regulatory protein
MDAKQGLSKAMELCSRKEYSEGEIRNKLKFWEVNPDDIDPIIETLVKEKFIDDLRFATAYVRDKVRLNHWGRTKIRYMLSMERVGRSFIDQALEEIDEELYLDALTELLQKKARELRNESNPFNRRQKLLKFAQGRGYEVDLALRIIKDL